ncbi:PspC domain-containing protein [Georgenia subflava]|uniref:PspC domain-containing protein n=1 Tax=Georgenia subflava TaxID=1622177 RepID=A0A6N7EJW4_9MICO|nr:PspC domain-containing protein [Georgenia subflava]MPV38652.1 PspC domain-containing protein [Georgenia subflava]
MTSTGTPDSPGPVPGGPGERPPAGDQHGAPSTGAPHTWSHGGGTHGESTHGGTHFGTQQGTAHGGSPHRTQHGAAQGGAGWGGPEPQPRPSTTAGFFASMRRTGIWRGQDRWIGGVAAGIARRLDVDPLLVRGILVVLSFFGGLGLLLYGIGWALLPEESDGRIHLQEALRGNVDAALAGAVIFVIIGLARPGTWWAGFGYWGDGWFLLSLAFVALVIVGVVALARRGSSAAASAPPPHGGTPWSPGPAPVWSGGQEFHTSSAGHDVHGTTTPPAHTAPGQAASGAAGAPRSAPEAPGTAYGQAAYGTGPESPGTAYGQAAYGTGRDERSQTAYGQAAYGATPAAGPSPAPGSVPWSATTAGSAGVPAGPYGPAQASYPPPVPPRPKSPGPGSALVTVILALALLTTAGLLLWDRVEPLGWMLPLTIGGAVLALLGLGVMIAGAVGRRGGALSVLGVLAALLVVPVTSATTVGPVAAGFTPGGAFGDHTFAPTTTEEAAEGYDLLAGDLDVDLSRLDPAGDPVTVPVHFGAGDLRVVLPADPAVRLDIELGAGQIQGRTSPGWSGPIEETTSALGPATWQDGSSIDATFISPAAQEDEAEIVLVITAGAGDITIEEQR